MDICAIISTPIYLLGSFHSLYGAITDLHGLPRSTETPQSLPKLRVERDELNRLDPDRGCEVLQRALEVRGLSEEHAEVGVNSCLLVGFGEEEERSLEERLGLLKTVLADEQGGEVVVTRAELGSLGEEKLKHFHRTLHLTGGNATA